MRLWYHLLAFVYVYKEHPYQCKDIEMGVNKVTILDGRVPHAVLLELLTDEGAGTMVKGVD